MKTVVRSQTVYPEKRSVTGILLLGIFFLLPLAAEGYGQNPQDYHLSMLSPEKLGRSAEFMSFGASGQYFQVDKLKGQTKLTLPLKEKIGTYLIPASIRLFRFDEKEKRWIIVPDSRYDPKENQMIAVVPGPGVYTPIGASQFAEVFEAQREIARIMGRGELPGMPDICRYILCAGDDFMDLPPDLGSQFPGMGRPEELRRMMGGICDQCFGQPGGPIDFPERDLPHLVEPAVKDIVKLYPWPLYRWCYDASNGCKPGPIDVGEVNYSWDDAVDLIVPGSTTPSYTDVDIRATVRYPATVSGANTPVYGTGKYPLVIFLHGNHAVCSAGGSCNHTCAPANRIPNHLGYNYLLNTLASWGFIALSIDGFDVTCSGGAYNMTDYEARGRLILEHLDRWKDWNSSGTDPWGGKFQNRVNMDRIGLSGHSRGGEGVVAAEYLNRVESHGYNIKAINAIAPTDQDYYVRYVPQVPYFLLLAASDGDVYNLQGLRTYDRTSVLNATVQSEKSMLWVYGANHNFFNTVWTPEFGYPSASDDGTGSGRLSASLQRLVACQSIVPFFRLYLKNSTGYRKLFRGEVVVEGLDGVEMYWSYQSVTRRELDNFDDGGDNPNQNSLGGSITTSGGFTEFNEYEFKNSGTDQYNSSFYHFTHGLVLGWNSIQTYESFLPSANKDVSQYLALSMRVAQIMDGGTLNPTDEPKTFRVGLKSTTGIVSNVNFDVPEVQSITFPYEDAGGKTVLGMIRIPLSTFKDGKNSFPLDDVLSVKFEFEGRGLIAVDDIQFTK